MPNPNHTLSTFNAHIAKGDGLRQTNGSPDGGKTFNWSERVAACARSRRTTPKRNATI